MKLGTRYYDDALVEALDDAGEVMWTRGLARAGELELEGFIPETSLAKLTRQRRYEPLVSKLVASGLWTRVPGGVRVTNWDHWQDRLDELARRRTADRDRQRKRRLRLQSDAEPTMSRDNGNLSRDVTPTEEEGDRDLGGSSLGVTHDARARDSEPPSRCAKHLKIKDPPKCGACADARKARNRWEVERARRVAAAPKCPVHQGQPADNCGGCRADELAPA